jgi:predicted nucleic acid-binding protein
VIVRLSGSDVYYLDTSALVKLVVREAESGALLDWLRATEEAVPGSLVTCDLSRTELYRAVRRVEPGRLTRVREVLGSLAVLSVTSDIFEHAARLDPPVLRSLDAIHVAAALSLGDELSGFVAYDDRLIAAAGANGVPAVTPQGAP